MYDSINSFVSESHNENIQQSVFMNQINQTAPHQPQLILHQPQLILHQPQLILHQPQLYNYTQTAWLQIIKTNVLETLN